MKITNFSGDLLDKEFVEKKEPYENSFLSEEFLNKTKGCYIKATMKHIFVTQSLWGSSLEGGYCPLDAVMYSRNITNSLAQKTITRQ